MFSDALYNMNRDVEVLVFSHEATVVMIRKRFRFKFDSLEQDYKK